jgi:hypothetical protein
MSGYHVTNTRHNTSPQGVHSIYTDSCSAGDSFPPCLCDTDSSLAAPEAAHLKIQTNQEGPVQLHRRADLGPEVTQP